MKMALMEGTLWKWTNYLSGWQPRYFVLDVGVLAYYKSQEEVGLGSRGSIKMGCCEISVHPTDTVRIDLKIPPDQFIYLRAATPTERQQWLVALGTAKACITQGPSSSHTEKPTGLSQISHLKEKMQELSMYRSLLLQQINTIKLMCTEKEDNQEFSEAATMLSATCDEFLKNLCDCMELAESNFRGSPTSPTSPLTPGKNIPSSKHSAFRRQLLHEPHRGSTPPPSPTSSLASSSVSSSVSGTVAVSENSSGSERIRSTALSKQESSLSFSPATSRTSINTAGQSDRTSGSSSLNSNAAPRKPANTTMSQHSLNSQSSQSEGEIIEPGSPTFFSMTTHKFEDVHVTADGGIPTKSFLAACTCILPFFDVLGSTAFAPVKMDIGGNIKKLSYKFDTDPKAFYTLHNIVYQEIKSNTCTAKNSATDALLWLKRNGGQSELEITIEIIGQPIGMNISTRDFIWALEFMQIFLSEVVKGREDLGASAWIAYGKTLRKFHGWVVRGVFSLAVKAVPYREDFLTTLGTSEKGVAPPEIVLRDTKSCVTALSALTNNLNQFYRKNKLDSDNTV